MVEGFICLLNAGGSESVLPFLFGAIEAWCIKPKSKWMSQKLKLASVEQALKVLR